MALTAKQIAAYKSPERSRRISEATKGKIISRQQRKQISAMMKTLWKTKDWTARNKKVSESKKGSKHPLWKGDEVSYKEMHAWVRRNYVIPKLCEMCHKKRRLDAANVSGNYKRMTRSDWMFICRKCHMIVDGRLEKFKQLNYK